MSSCELEDTGSNPVFLPNETVTAFIGHANLHRKLKLEWQIDR
jgi:hypothetical protein